jgi:hypothetical protein
VLDESVIFPVSRPKVIDERADFLEEQSRVGRSGERRLAGLDTAQLTLLDEILNFWVSDA